MRELLKNYDNEAICDYLTERELEFYNNDDDIIIQLGTGIPNFDLFNDTLKLYNIHHEMNVTDEVTNSLTIYKTNIHNLYYIRYEGFDTYDNDTINNILVFTDDIYEYM